MTDIQSLRLKHPEAVIPETSSAGQVPEISVVVCTYDRPDALRLFLNAMLLQQTRRPFELILVDNHPQSCLTDPVRAEFPGIVWLQEKIAGLSRARNRGIDAARGTVIVTTDDDVLPPPGWLDLLTTPLFEGPRELAATTGNCLPVKVETEAEALFEAYGGLQHGASPACFDAAWMGQWRVGFPHLWRIGTTANGAYRASALRDPAIGPFETRLGAGTPASAWEDLYHYYRILRAGYRICYVPEAWVTHAHREEMDALLRQLRGYRRGETAFLWLMWTRHRDPRAFGQAFLWIPYWRARLIAGELLRRLAGRRTFSLRVLWAETLAYFEGPTAIKRTKS